MTTLAALVDEGLRKSGAEYAIGQIEGVSNHLPMSLIALDKLGASQQQLDDFYRWHSPRLRPVSDDGIIINADNIFQFAGKHSCNFGYRRFFLDEIERKSIEEVVDHHVPKLIAGMAGGAFHPLIRLAYGLEFDTRAK